MNKPAAAFQAVFSDWKLIRTRKIVQLVFEVPVEMADQAYQVLGGMPDPGKSVWCAVARLEVQPSSDVVEADKAAFHKYLTEQHERRKRSWDELSAAEQAGIRCAEPAFHKFLREHHQITWRHQATMANYEGNDDKLAAAVVRHICNVSTRAAINPANLMAMAAWDELDRDYRVWMMVPA